MEFKLRIAGIVKESIVDGPGIRFVVFTQGCNHKCPGCHNPHTHSFEGGTMVSIDEIIESVKENPILDGITLSGGEPFEQAESLAELAHRIHRLGMNVVTYTGYTYEQIIDSLDERKGWARLIEESDLLIDGRFDQSRKNMLLRFRGSENQRIIDLKNSARENRVVLLDS
jgi:anaerobic ribonucleoside-triphosphate reductase activating protein